LPSILDHASLPPSLPPILDCRVEAIQAMLKAEHEAIEYIQVLVRTSKESGSRKKIFIYSSAPWMGLLLGVGKPNAPKLF
jgi:hypothetical protein